MNLWNLVLLAIATWLVPLHAAPAVTPQAGGLPDLPTPAVHQAAATPAPHCPALVDPMSWPKDCPLPAGG